jgi:hypothetical protein
MTRKMAKCALGIGPVANILRAIELSIFIKI